MVWPMHDEPSRISGPRWPTAGKLGEVAAVYVAVALLAGLLAFLVLLSVAKPAIPALLALGICIGVLAARHWRWLSDTAARLTRHQST